jgi:hypothetical protein
MAPDDPRADLAEAMVPRACEFACLVHDADAEGAGAFLAAIEPHEVNALLIVLAAMVPVDDRSPGALLSWAGSVPEAVKWRQVPLEPAGEAAREPEPCPSLAAYRRHKAAGEPYEDCGCGEAARAVWRSRKRLQAAEERADDAA